MDDEALELELETVWASDSVVSEASSLKKSEETTGAALTFDFPDWGLDLYSESKRLKLRHSVPGEFSAKKNEQKPVNWYQTPVEGCPILTLPDCIYIHILESLDTRDLCSSKQVCTRWYGLCSLDCLWEKHVKCGTKDSDLPRWILFKSNALSCRMAELFTYSKKYYELLKEALESWWEFGQPNGLYSSSHICPLIQRMTLSNWIRMYDVVAGAFMQRSDQLAGMLIFQKNTSTISQGQQCEHLGVQLWCSLRKLWCRYIAWIKLLSLHCNDLNYGISRCLDTPTLYNKGIACFRSQVILSYELRGVLQQGLSLLSNSEPEGTEQDIELLCSLYHMLQELDVVDDFTLPPESHTQMKLRRCFLGGQSSREHSRAQVLAARLENEKCSYL